MILRIVGIYVLARKALQLRRSASTGGIYCASIIEMKTFVCLRNTPHERIAAWR